MKELRAVTVNVPLLTQALTTVQAEGVPYPISDAFSFVAKTVLDIDARAQVADDTGSANRSHFGQSHRRSGRQVVADTGR